MVIGYHSRPSRVTLPAEKFTQYLRQEGLDAIVAARARTQTSEREGRELFSRSAKSLVRSGALAAGTGDRPLGFPIELVAERNPYEMRSRRHADGAPHVSSRRRSPAHSSSPTTSARRTTS
jgi:hypothetical protein